MMVQLYNNDNGEHGHNNNDDDYIHNDNNDK